MRKYILAVFASFALLGGGAGCTLVLGIQDFTGSDGGDSSVGDEQGSEGGAQTDAPAMPDATDGTAMSDALDATAADHADAGDASDAGSSGDATVDGGGDAMPTQDAGGATDATDAGQGGGNGDGGDSSTCLAGGACSPAECQVGQYVCGAGGRTCGSVQPASNGTSCGGDGGAADSGATGSVCNQGVCTPCNSGGDCSVANSCKKSVYVCTTGTAVCTQTGNANDGTTCGSGMVCSGGVCTTCMVGNPCTPTNACHKGSISACTGGVATCTDTMTAANDGMICGMNEVCSGGTCTPCAANVSCTPANECHTGLTSCATGVSVCVDTNTNQMNGSGCTGTDKCNQTYTCQSGMCTGSNPVMCMASDQCHSAGTCDPTSGTCSNPALTGNTCTGSNKCFQTYTCQSGTCTGSSAVMCTASDPCHSAGTCDQTSGACSNPALTGNTCTGSDACFQTYTCQSGTCTGSNPVSCSGGQVCSGGTCGCPTGTTKCGTTCVNVMGTDASNCGACGHGCLTGGSCSAGICQPIPFVSSGVGSINDLATDGTNVFWADGTNQEVDQVSVPGGSKLILAGGGQAGVPSHVAADTATGTVWWTTVDGNVGIASKGMLNAGSIQGQSCGSIVSAVANPAASTLDVLIGDLSTLLYSATMTPPVSCLADTTTGISGALGTSLSRGWVFGNPGMTQVVYGANLDGPPNATIPNQPGVNWVADDGTYGYWATSEPALRRAPFNAPSSVATLLANAGGTVAGIATDGTNLYYSIPSGIYHIPVAGGSGVLYTSKAGQNLKYSTGALYFNVGTVIYKLATL